MGGKFSLQKDTSAMQGSRSYSAVGVESGGVGPLCGVPSQSLSPTEVVKCESNCVLFLGLTCGTPWTPSPSQ